MRDVASKDRDLIAKFQMNYLLVTRSDVKLPSWELPAYSFFWYASSIVLLFVKQNGRLYQRELFFWYARGVLLLVR